MRAARALAALDGDDAVADDAICSAWRRPRCATACAATRSTSRLPARASTACWPKCSRREAGRSASARSRRERRRPGHRRPARHAGPGPRRGRSRPGLDRRRLGRCPVRRGPGWPGRRGACAPPPARCATSGHGNCRASCRPVNRCAACRRTLPTNACSAAWTSPPRCSSAARWRSAGCSPKATAASCSCPWPSGCRRAPRRGWRRRWTRARWVSSATAAASAGPCRIGVVAFDEGTADDAPLPAALADRLAFHVNLAQLSLRQCGAAAASAEEIAAARRLWPAVTLGDEMTQALCGIAMRLGVASLRASVLALRAARAIAALGGHDEVQEDDALMAARLVLAPRATVLPQPDDEPATDEPPPTAPPPDDSGEPGRDDSRDQETRALEDRLVAATLASLPAGLLAALPGARTRTRAGARRGLVGVAALRPPGRVTPGRAARRRTPGPHRHAARRRTLADGCAAPRCQAPARRHPRPAPTTSACRACSSARGTTTLFVIDASGSSALHRLAEAKGAVDLLLADCYVRRDQVAVIAFRGRGAELLLPPTRSLVRAKRSLAALPGGGGTPLAAGLDAACRAGRTGASRRRLAGDRAAHRRPRQYRARRRTGARPCRGRRAARRAPVARPAAHGAGRRHLAAARRRGAAPGAARWTRCTARCRTPARPSCRRPCRPCRGRPADGKATPMDWQREGPSWPHHERSRFVTAAGQRWHVQTWPDAGGPDAPTLLLLHGTGASTHSWRDLAPLLAQQAGVIAIDLPGHGFSGPAASGAHRDGATLPGMARGVRALLAALGATPQWLVGHSAGAAIAVRMALDDAAGLHGIVSLNGALLPLHGLAGRFFSPMAKLLALNPLVPRVFRLARRRPGGAAAAHRKHRLDAGRLGRGALPASGERPQPCRRGAAHDGALGPASAAGRTAAARRAAAPGRRRARPHGAAGRRQARAAVAGARCGGHVGHDGRPGAPGARGAAARGGAGTVAARASSSGRRVAEAQKRGTSIISGCDDREAVLMPSSLQALMLRGSCH